MFHNGQNYLKSYSKPVVLAGKDGLLSLPPWVDLRDPRTALSNESPPVILQADPSPRVEKPRGRALTDDEIPWFLRPGGRSQAEMRCGVR